MPLHDEQQLLDLLCLEGAQAGLSWSTILRKRQGYRRAFAGFDPEVVAAFGRDDIERLVLDPSIVRNRAKIEAAVANSRGTLELRGAGGLAAHLWAFVGGRPKVNHWRTTAELPAATPESTAMSRDLKKRGFGFVGPTICYALMQAAGLVNDHLVDCFRWAEIETPEAARQA